MGRQRVHTPIEIVNVCGVYHASMVPFLWKEHGQWTQAINRKITRVFSHTVSPVVKPDPWLPFSVGEACPAWMLHGSAHLLRQGHVFLQDGLLLHVQDLRPVLGLVVCGLQLLGPV